MGISQVEVFVTLSVISAFLSGLVVLTAMFSSMMMLSSTRPFSHIIFFISLCDMLGSVGNLFGFPQNRTPQCSIQGFMLQFFFPASWMWTAALVYQIYCMIVYNKLWISLYMVHFICWIIPLCFALIPLSTNHYGVIGKLAGNPCHLGGNVGIEAYDAQVWLVVTYSYLPMAILTFMSICGLIMVFGKHSQAFDSKRKAIVKTSVCYPIIMLISWLPVGIYIILNLSRTVHFQYTVSVFVSILTTLNGVFIGIVYFINSPRAHDVTSYVPSDSASRVSEVELADENAVYPNFVSN
eukprot:gene6873-9414_t